MGNPDNEPRGTGEAGQDDPARDHWLEPGAPAEVTEVIARHAAEVQEKLKIVGTGGPDRLSTRDAWADVFGGESIQFHKLGHTVDKYRGRDPGGYLVAGEAQSSHVAWERRSGGAGAVRSRRPSNRAVSWPSHRPLMPRLRPDSEGRKLIRLD